MNTQSRVITQKNQVIFKRTHMISLNFDDKIH